MIDIIDIRYKAKEKNLDNLRNLDAQFGWSIFEILPKKELDKVLFFSHHHEFSKNDLARGWKIFQQVSEHTGNQTFAG